MDYLVVAADGQKYGPANEDVLRQWIGEGRIGQQSTLEDVSSGKQIQAVQVPGLFPAAPPQTAPPTTFAQHPAAGAPQQRRPAYGTQESSGPLIGIIIRCALGLLLFFVFKGIGLIVTAYALYYAIQLKSYGSKYGTIALVMAGLTLAVIGAGWFLRLNGM